MKDSEKIRRDARPVMRRIAPGRPIAHLPALPHVVRAAFRAREAAR